MLSIANRWAHQLAITTAVLFSAMHCQTPMIIHGHPLVTHYWLRRQMVDVFECEGWTEQLWVSATTQPSLRLQAKSTKRLLHYLQTSQVSRTVSIIFHL